MKKHVLTSLLLGASATISLVMPVSSVILGVMGLPGLTKVSNSSTTSPFFTMTAPISVIYSTPGLDVEGTVKKILTTEYVQNALKGIPNV